MTDFAKTFESFIGTQIFEASTLSTLKLPKKMISAVHQKEEHKREDQKNLGYVNQGGKPLVIEYKYFRPSHEIKIPAPFVFNGKLVSDPKGIRKSQYPDFAQYLQDLEFGPLRVLLCDPENEFFMYLYHKSPRVNGEQYAILIWDKDKQSVADYGFVGLTIDGVTKELVREVHKLKGGNTNQKVQEIVKQLTKGAPSKTSPLSVYELEVQEDKSVQPRDVKQGRKEVNAEDAANLLLLFISKYSKIIPRLNQATLSKLKAKVDRVSGSRPTIPNNIISDYDKLAAVLVNDYSGADSYNPLMRFLADKFISFRRELYRAGQAGVTGARSAYSVTKGVDYKNEVEALAKMTGSYFSASTEYDKEDPRHIPGKHWYGRSNRSGVNPKEPRSVYQDTEVASVPSMIRLHSLDGCLRMFATYLITDKIVNNAEDILATFGIAAPKEQTQPKKDQFSVETGDDAEEESDFGSWVI